MLILPNLIDGHHSLNISPTFGWYLFSSSEGRKVTPLPSPRKGLVLFLDLQGNVRKPYKLSIFAEALFNNEPFL